MRTCDAPAEFTRCRSIGVRGLVGAAFALYCGAGVWTIDSPSFAMAASEVDDGCPRAALREMMASAAVHNDVGDVAALELEVLRLCSERQKLIVEVAEGESRLAELRGVKRSGHVAATPETEIVGVLEDLPPPTKASARNGASGAREPTTSPSPFLEPESAPRPDVGDLSSAKLQWTTVYGSAGNWVAGITDGAKTWHLRVGDELPSGVRVESIRNRPPGVRVGFDGEAWQIPGPGNAREGAEGTSGVDTES